MSLGFDTTIQPVKDGQFDITVHSNSSTRTFRTIRTISSYSAEPLRGQATRIFEAIELDGDGKPIGSPVVLKDAWIDSDRKREGDILAELHAAADEEGKRLIEKLFLTTICHGDVRTEPGTVDDTAMALMRGLEITKDHPSLFQLQRNSSVQKKTSGTGSRNLRAFTPDEVPLHRIRYDPKTHYRTVYKEVCVTIDSIRILPDVMQILTEIVSGAF
jgi:hypothetical protein